MTVDDRFAAHARDWGVKIDEIRTTETSQLGFGTRHGRPVVLKVIRKENGEEWDCGNVLASLVQQMSSAPRHLAGVRPVDRLLPEFAQFRDGASGFIPKSYVDRAEELFSGLCATQRAVRLLHGDLHHYNVLSDHAAGWVVIDPWGAIGEVEFELGAALRNPIDPPHLLTNRRALERRLRIYETRLTIDAERALTWAFAMTVLAILWPFDEKTGLDLRAPFAHAARSMHELMDSP